MTYYLKKTPNPSGAYPPPQDFPGENTIPITAAQRDAVIENGHSVVTIPVTCFDWKMAVVADTVAMSQPHEVDYALRFDSASITPVSP